MKIDRMIGILAILLQREQVTAPELAARFEVSRRTISRDIDALARAGVPVTTSQGAGGGISVMPGYRVDRTLLTRPELSAILAGLAGLDSVSESPRYRQLMEKLDAGGGPDEALRIDLASYYRASLAPKLELLRQAITQRRPVGFRYAGPSGEGPRRVEPGQLLFEWSSWYLRGWCRDRQAFRTFKLARMEGLKLLEGHFLPRPLPGDGGFDPARAFPARVCILAAFDPSVRWRLLEEYGADQLEERDGRLLLRAWFPDEDYPLGWLLSFGDAAELLQPAALRAKLAALARRIAARHEAEAAPPEPAAPAP